MNAEGSTPPFRPGSLQELMELLQRAATALDELSSGVRTLQLRFDRFERKQTAAEQQTEQWIDFSARLLRQLRAGHPACRDHANLVASVLELCQFKEINPAAGDLFDPALHQPIDTKNTPKPEYHGRIFRCKYVGLSRNGHAFGPYRAHVIVYRLVSQAAQSKDPVAA